MMGQQRGLLLGLSLSFLLLIACTPEPSSRPSSPEEEARLRHRLNKIFYWQIADELKLNPEEEAQVVQVLEAYQDRKEAALMARHDSLKAIEDAVGKGDTGVDDSRRLMEAYRRSLTAASDLDIEQLKSLEKIMGPQKLLRFIKSRREMSDRILEVIR